MTKLAPVSSAPAANPSSSGETKTVAKKPSPKTSALDSLPEETVDDRIKALKSRIQDVGATDFNVIGHLKNDADRAYKAANRSQVDPQIYAKQQKAAREDLLKTQNKLASLSLPETSLKDTPATEFDVVGYLKSEAGRAHVAANPFPVDPNQPQIRSKCEEKQQAALRARETFEKSIFSRSRNESSATDQSHASIGLTLTNDAMRVARQNPLISKLPLPVVPLRVYTAIQNNAGSEHLAADVAIELGVKTVSARAMVGAVGGPATSGVILAGHVVQHLRDHTPSPSMEELTRLSLSSDPMEREMARTWFETNAAADILTAPVKAIDFISEKAKEIWNKKS